MCVGRDDCIRESVLSYCLCYLSMFKVKSEATCLQSATAWHPNFCDQTRSRGSETERGCEDGGEMGQTAGDASGRQL